MTNEERERSKRQRVFDLISAARKRVNPKTAEHIAEVARRNGEDDLQDWVRDYGWRRLVHECEDDHRARWRPTRSGHQNASGRYQQLRNILEMPVTVGEAHLSLGELDLGSLQVLIASYDQRAGELIAERDRLARIEKAMRADGVDLVADLGSERVELLYVGEPSNA